MGRVRVVRRMRRVKREMRAVRVLYAEDGEDGEEGDEGDEGEEGGNESDGVNVEMRVIRRRVIRMLCVVNELFAVSEQRVVNG